MSSQCSHRKTSEYADISTRTLPRINANEHYTSLVIAELQMPGAGEQAIDCAEVVAWQSLRRAGLVMRATEVEQQTLRSEVNEKPL
jgi:hypothetical protein